MKRANSSNSILLQGLRQIEKENKAFQRYMRKIRADRKKRQLSDTSEPSAHIRIDFGGIAIVGTLRIESLKQLVLNPRSARKDASQQQLHKTVKLPNLSRAAVHR